jgi:hypothetical protein
MSRTFVVRLLLSAVAVACEVLLILRALAVQPRFELPLQIERTPAGVYVVRARGNERLPAPLIDGDMLAPKQMRSADRAAALFPDMGVAAQTSINLAVMRDGVLLRASTASIASAPTRLQRLDVWLGGVLSEGFVFVLALLTLWRGRDRAARGLCLFAFASLLNNGLYAVATPPVLNFWIQQLRAALFPLMQVPGLYVMAEALAQRGLTPRTRTVARVATAALVLAGLVVRLAPRISFAYFAAVPPYSIFAADTPVIAALSALPVLVLAIGYRHAGHEGRLRIRWVLWSTALLFATIAVVQVLSQSRHPYGYDVFNVVLPGVALLGYLYAVLRTRLLDVSFVVDRALVFALLAALLFGVFALVERELHHFALGEQLSWAVEAVTALLLAMALSPLHRRLEHWIEGLLFRQQRLAVATLRRFATECAFVEREARLLQLAIEHLQAQAVAVAIYERVGSAYPLRAAHGESWPATVDADDPIFVSLRAGRPELNLKEVRNSFGTEGFAFPMRITESLTGAIICRPRDGEQFSADVRSVLAEVARSIGIALYILRQREQARLVADIAWERVDRVAARDRALALVQST